MHIVQLWQTNEGLIEIEIQPGTTLQDLVNERGLANYDFTVQGVIVARNAWATTSLDGVTEIWATQGVKGA
jgi:sulfur carrier protein ThiS